MNIINVPGKNKRHKVMIYTLSTCVWCKMTKQFLKDLDVEYNYVDIDLCREDEKNKIKNSILEKGGELSYPVILIDDILINGFVKKKIKEVLEV